MKSVWNMSPQFEQKQQHRQARRAASACTPTGLAGLSFRPAPFAPHERLPPLLLGYLLSMFSMVKGNFCLSVLMSPSMLEGNLNHERRRSRHFYFSPITSCSKLLVCVSTTACQTLIVKLGGKKKK